MDYLAAGFTVQTWGIIATSLAAIFVAIWSGAEAAKKRDQDATTAAELKTADAERSDQRHAAVVTMLDEANVALREQQELRAREQAAATEKEATGLRQQAEQLENRRKLGVLDRLRDLYRTSQDGISNEIMANMAWPPDAWMNAELGKIGEQWSVASSGPNIRVIPHT